MKRLVYSPKAYVYVEVAKRREEFKSPIINLSSYVVSGEVSRKVNTVSTAEVTIRNPDRMWTPLGDPVFHPMDKITIFLERLPKHPIQVFTGYLDSVPYYQMYPGNCTLTASCTLKKLQHTYVDMALPFMVEFMQQYGWIPDLASGQLRTPASYVDNANGGGGLSGTTLPGVQAVTQATTTATPAATSGTVGMIGDSLGVGVQSSGDLGTKLGNNWTVQYDVANNIRADQGVAKMRAMKAKDDPAVWVIGLGSNDDRMQTASFRRSVKTMLQIADGKPVYWINIKVASGHTQADKLNKVLVDQKALFPNMQIIDWEHADVSLDSDMGLHPNANGYKKRAQLIADAVRGGTTTTTTTTGQPLVPVVTPDQFLQTDGSIGEMLFATMKQIGGWNPDDIYIESMPTGVPRKILGIFDELQANEEATQQALGQMFKDIIGTTALGGAGGNVGATSGTPTSGSFSKGQLITLAKNHGFPDPNLAAAVAMAESQGDPNSKNLVSPDYSIGLWQINMLAHHDRYGSEEELTNPDTNAKAAFAISSSGTNWQPWSTYKNGAYRQYLSNTTAQPLPAAGNASAGPSPDSGSSNSGSNSSATSANNTATNVANYQADHPGGQVTPATQGGATPTTSTPGDISQWYVPPLTGDAATKNLARTDMGVDFNPPGNIHAIGNAVVTEKSEVTTSGAGGNGPWVTYRLTDGPLKGACIYTCELWAPLPGIQKGKILTKGEKIGSITGHIELGYAKGPTGQWNTLTPYNGAADGTAMPGGKMFARLCRALGVDTADDPGPGDMGPPVNGRPPQWDGSTVSGGGGSTSGSGATIDPLAAGKASAFAAVFNFPTIQAVSEALLLTGEKALMNDTPLLPFIQELCQGSLRNFQSMPNGDFFAFFPDYFGGFGKRSPYWNIDDVEILEGKIDLTDEALATHVFVSGDTLDYDGSVSFQEKLMSTGVVTIHNAGVASFIQRPSSNKKTPKKKGKGEKGPGAGEGDVGETPFLKDAQEALEFLNRYGARVLVQDAPFIRNHFFEVFLAFQTFMLCWARQFNTTFTFTFMPEIFPGGLVAFPTHSIQMYVDEVHHSFDYTDGFVTQANLSAPAAMKGSHNAVADGMAVGDILDKFAPEEADPKTNTTATDKNNPNRGAHMSSKAAKSAKDSK